MGLRLGVRRLFPWHLPVLFVKRSRLESRSGAWNLRHSRWRRSEGTFSVWRLCFQVKTRDGVGFVSWEFKGAPIQCQKYSLPHCWDYTLIGCLLISNHFPCRDLVHHPIETLHFSSRGGIPSGTWGESIWRLVPAAFAAEVLPDEKGTSWTTRTSPCASKEVVCAPSQTKEGTRIMGIIPLRRMGITPMYKPWKGHLWKGNNPP